MNKSNKLISLIFILLTGCYDPFDLTRNDIISDEMVFDNPTLQMHSLDLYDRAQFHIKSGNGNLNMGLISSFEENKKLWCFLANSLYSSS